MPEASARHSLCGLRPVDCHQQVLGCKTRADMPAMQSGFKCSTNQLGFRVPLRVLQQERPAFSATPMTAVGTLETPVMPSTTRAPPSSRMTSGTTPSAASSPASAAAPSCPPTSSSCPNARYAVLLGWNLQHVTVHWQTEALQETDAQGKLGETRKTAQAA